jgi:hypothetical protein
MGLRAAIAVHLRPELASRVAVVARLAAAMGVEAYLVGGTVRDLLLGRDGPDLDFVTVGDGLALATAIHRELGGRLQRHSAFMTADVVDADGVHLDVATARQESYAAVAALPAVRPAAALEDDLRRRDFTVNAMALRLVAPGDAGGNAERPEALDLGSLSARGSGPIDPHGGRRDLAAGLLRVLHERSFFDDPTRVLRGARFEARLGFRLTPESEAQARQAVAAGAFAQLTGSRLRHELELLLGAEPVPAAALAGLERLQDLGVLAAVHSRLALDDAARQRLRAVAAEHAWYLAAGPGVAGGAGMAPAAGVSLGRAVRQAPSVRLWLLLLLALAAGLAEPDRAELAERLLLAGDELRLLSGFGRRLAAAVPLLGAGALPHEVDAALAGLADEELLVLAATGGADGSQPARQTGQDGDAPVAKGTSHGPLESASPFGTGGSVQVEPQVRSWVRRYLTGLRPLALAIRGADLLAAGARPGPEVGNALRVTREARLDGRIGAGEELGFALACLHEARSGADGGRPVEGGEGMGRWERE